MLSVLCLVLGSFSWRNTVVVLHVDSYVLLHNSVVLIRLGDIVSRFVVVAMCLPHSLLRSTSQEHCSGFSKAPEVFACCPAP